MVHVMFIGSGPGNVLQDWYPDGKEVSVSRAEWRVTGYSVLHWFYSIILCHNISGTRRKSASSSRIHWEGTNRTSFQDLLKLVRSTSVHSWIFPDRWQSQVMAAGLYESDKCSEVRRYDAVFDPLSDITFSSGLYFHSSFRRHYKSAPRNLMKNCIDGFAWSYYI